MTAGITTTSAGHATLSSSSSSITSAEPSEIKAVWRENLFNRTYANTPISPTDDLSSKKWSIRFDVVFASILLISAIAFSILNLPIPAIIYGVGSAAVFTKNYHNYQKYKVDEAFHKAVSKLQPIFLHEELYCMIKDNPQIQQVLKLGLGNKYDGISDKPVGERGIFQANENEENRAKDLLEFEWWQKSWDCGNVNKALLLIGREQQLALAEEIARMKNLVSEKQHPAVENTLKAIFLRHTIELLRESIDLRLSRNPFKQQPVDERARTFEQQAKSLYESTMSIREAHTHRLREAELALTSEAGSSASSSV